ncbi:polyprenyl synthetase family protein [Streptomyces sp. NPDC101227]|uniref:polyprenyl synthetase family protein n=1 Tax=Streptomyces sp. NPDC101227 TaxID=3366136 RepID=UPI00380263F1
MLAGDLMGFLALKPILDADIPPRTRQAMLLIQVQAGRDVALGQILDLERDTYELPSDEFLSDVAEFKGARYSILSPMLLGLAAVGSVPGECADGFRRYARLSAESIIMFDDYIDVFGVNANLGKTPGADIRQGRRSHAIRDVLQAADPRDRSEVEEILRDPSGSADGIQRVGEIGRALGVDETIRSQIRDRAEPAATEAASWRRYWRHEAVDALARFPLLTIEQLFRETGNGANSD